MSGSDGGSSSSGSSYVTITVSPDPGIKLRFDGMVATEELGRPFLITLDVSSGEIKADIGSMLGGSVTVSMTDADGTTKRYFNGILTRAAYAGMAGGVHHYSFELRPWIWLLSRTHDCKIFQNKSAFDIINEVFRDQGFSAQDKRQAQAGDTVLEYCVQYRESSFEFVTRLMEEFGIYYYFEHTESEHTLYLADDPNSHTALTTKIPFQTGQTETRAVEDHIAEWTSDLHLQPGAYTFRDYNFTTPAADLTSKSLKAGEYQHGNLEIYDYPGRYGTPDIGQKLADVRMQDLKARQQVFDGRSNARPIRCGVKFKLDKFHDESMNDKEYLITHAVTSITVAESESDTRDKGNLIDSHRVQFTAIPGTTPFRLEQRTARPMIRGPQTAVVVGESGEEITTDQYGRVKVQFYWDRVGTKNQDSSCWIRVAQSWGGAGWGAMFIPRIGMEVVVVFLEGDPDRPLITGVVYNATQTVPNPLPNKKVLTTFKTNSSKGGGGYNELTFDDTKGSEKVTFQAQYDYDKTVLNNETVNITKDTTTTVKEGNRSVTVSKGNDSHTVSQGNVTVDVSTGGSKSTVKQNIEMTSSSASIKLTATSSIELTCGGSTLKLEPAGITLKTAKFEATADATMSLKASGKMDADGGATMTLKAGIIKIN